SVTAKWPHSRSAPCPRHSCKRSWTRTSERTRGRDPHPPDKEIQVRNDLRTIVRGYLGNSARARAKNGSRQPRDGNGKRSSRRQKPMREEFPDDEEFDVIPAAELELTKNAMNLSELKNRPASELV